MKRRKRKHKKIAIGFKIFASILTILSLILIGMLVYLNILSNLLLGIVVGIIILINGGCCYLLLKSKKKKTGLIISSVLIILYSILNFYIYKTTNFLNNLDSNYTTYNYSVVVVNNSKYKKIKDINNKTLGYYDEETNLTKDSLEKITKKIEINVDDYDNIYDLAVELFENKTDAILIEDSYLDAIEIDGKPINKKVKKIYSFSIRIKNNDNSKDINVTKEPFNIYISGIDTYGEITSVSRSDVNMVVSVNPKTRQILLTSIPRDYYVQLHDTTGYKDKLTHAGMYGVEMSIATIEDLLDTEINYYVKVNFNSVIDIVDAIGGVTIDSDYAFTSKDGYKFKEGNNEVNGQEALSFVRERKAFVTGDRQRVKNQQALLEAMFKKCTNKSMVTKYTKLLDTVSNSFITNMKMNRMTSLVKMQLTKNYTWNIVSNSLNGTDYSNYTYSFPSTHTYVMQPTDESVTYSSELIKNVFEGKKLNKKEIEGEKDINGVFPPKSKTNNKNKTNNTSEPITKEPVEEQNVPEETKEGLKANLIKQTIEITKGDDYIYHGVSATYNKQDITNNTNLKTTFNIAGKSIPDYNELILYISRLESGTYNITHIVNYNGETINLTQTLTIKEPIINEEETNQTETNDIPPTTSDTEEEDNIIEE